MSVDRAGACVSFYYEGKKINFPVQGGNDEIKKKAFGLLLKRVYCPGDRSNQDANAE